MTYMNSEPRTGNYIGPVSLNGPASEVSQKQVSSTFQSEKLQEHFLRTNIFYYNNMDITIIMRATIIKRQAWS